MQTPLIALIAISYALVVRQMWNGPSLWGLWLLLPILSVYALYRILRDTSVANRMVALLAIPAYLVRARYEHLPANWYLDVTGPVQAVEEAYMHRGGGFANFFRGLSTFVDLSGSAVFMASVISSTLAVVFLSSALRTRGRDAGWPPWTHLIWGLLLAFDPILVEVGASDAPHNISLLAFSLTMWCYREVLEAKPGELNHKLLYLLPLVASLPGLTRPGLTVTVLIVPLLLFPKSLDSSQRNKVFIATALGVAAAATAWLGRDLGAAVRPLELEKSLRWLAFQSKPLIGIFGVHGPTDNLDNQHELFALCIGVFVFAGVRKRSIPGFITLLTYFLIASPKLLSDFAADPIGQDLTVSRYIVVQITVYLLMVAVGASWGLQMILNLRKPGVSIAAVMLMIWLWIGSGFSTGALYAPQTLSFRLEYSFLQQHITELPPNSTIYLEWLEVFPSKKKAPDTALSPRYAPLLFLRPDLRYIVLDDETHIPTNCQDCFYYRGASCSLDPEHVREWAPAEDVVHLERLLRRCDSHDPQVTSWIAQEEHAAKTLFWRVRDNKVNLGLGRVSNAHTPPPGIPPDSKIRTPATPDR